MRFAITRQRTNVLVVAQWTARLAVEVLKAILIIPAVLVKFPIVIVVKA